MADPDVIIYGKPDTNLNNAIRRGQTNTVPKVTQPANRPSLAVQSDDPPPPSKTTVDSTTKISTARKSLGLTQKELALTLKIKASDVQYYETPGKPIVNKDLYGKICDKLKIRR